MKISLLFLIVSFPIFASAQIEDETLLLNSGKKFDEANDVWIDISTTLLNSTRLEDHEIYYPHALTVNESNELAIMAWDDRAIYIFSEEDFSNPKKLRSRKGKGPREYDLPFDMYLNSNELWISDINLRKIDAWDINTNEVIRSYSFDNVFVKPDQIAICSDMNSDYSNIYILSTQYGLGDKNKEGILHRYELKENEIKHVDTFQKLTDPNEMYGYVITGDINCNDEGEIFYSGDFTGTIRKYSKSGKMVFYRIAQNFTANEPLFFEKGEGMTVYNPDAPRINGDVFLNGDEIFIGRSRSIDRYVYGIDVYNPYNGQYLYSFKFPTPAKEYAITENRLFIVEYKAEDGFDLKVYEYTLNK